MSSTHKAMELAVTGDTLMTRRLTDSTDPGFLGVRQILRGSDAAFTNLETTIQATPEYAAAHSGGTWMLSPPYIAEELASLGLNMLSRANNHSMDWAVAGMRETSSILNAHQLTHAGVGENLAEAREAKYRDVPGGRIALIAATSTFPDWGRAGNARKTVRGRPGLNPLRWSDVYLLSPDAYRSMRGIATESSIPQADPDAALDLFGTRFLPWDRTAVGMQAHAGDIAGNLRAVIQARSQSDWVVVSLHTHEDGGRGDLPAPFAVEFAHLCIDKGADIVMMHGAHALRGIEIYRGKPIFYGLGSFIYQAQQVETLPADAFEDFELSVDADDEAVLARFEQLALDATTLAPSDRSPHLIGSPYSILALPRFNGGALAGIRLVPLTLGPDKDRKLCGYPRVAEGQLAERIIEMVARCSTPMGTKIRFCEGQGVVDLPPNNSRATFSHPLRMV